ncbi:phosphotransferase family protein [Anaerosporobacter faecicola]|uniref:phosphotransferase family protein n=1 Tax=Anaerosporobacter faecicola TaxID=2718714 RepID=UPI00143B342A|nr:aminoglycoside phosphotransferase family protein [Anaerosporobacter faecicola]
MEYVTKNRQTVENIENMVARAFPGVKMERCVELTEGSFNVAYRVDLANKKETILKIAPSKSTLVMSCEKNIMFSEVDAIRMIKKNTSVPVPEILYYDNTKELIDSEYFFMSVVEGDPFNKLENVLPQEKKDYISERIGKYDYEMNQLTNKVFGYYGQPDKQGDNWYIVFKSMLQGAFADAKKINMAMPLEEETVLSFLERDKAYFAEVTKPSFVHWDLWAGNVFVKDGEVNGIIDFERCVWADPLMEAGFRPHEKNEHFFKGYGIGQLTKAQQRRAKWYDIYLYMLMSMEGEYRHYETDDFPKWGRSMLEKCLEEVKE